MTSQIASGFADRLGGFMERVNPGPHKIKRVAQRLNISPGMAKLLLRGEGWTAARIAQVWGIYGPDFVSFVFNGAPMSAVDADLHAIKADLALLKARLGVDDNEGDRGVAANLPPMAGQEASATGGVARRAGGVLEGPSHEVARPAARVRP